MNYKELAMLIDAGKDEEILKALKGEPEQAVSTYMGMLDVPHRQYLVNLLNPFVFNENEQHYGDLKTQIADWALNNYAGDDVPEEVANGPDDPAWNAFFAEGSPYDQYEKAMIEKYFTPEKYPNSWEYSENGNDEGDDESEIWEEIDSGEFPAKEFAFDGTHKFYILANDTEAREAIEAGYEIYPIEQLQELYDSADPLKYISSWDLGTDYISQSFPSDNKGVKRNVTDRNHLPIEGGDEVFEDGGISITDPRFDATSRWWFETPEDATAHYGNKYADAIKQFYAEHPWETKDVNGDGDTDVAAADTNGNGKPDTAIIAGDDAKEEKDAVKAAKEDLGLDGEDDTSTGKKKKELDEDNTDVLSDKKQKSTCSDSRQKNIISALTELRF